MASTRRKKEEEREKEVHEEERAERRAKMELVAMESDSRRQQEMSTALQHHDDGRVRQLQREQAREEERRRTGLLSERPQNGYTPQQASLPSSPQRAHLHASADRDDSGAALSMGGRVVGAPPAVRDPVQMAGPTHSLPPSALDSPDRAHGLKDVMLSRSGMPDPTYSNTSFASMGSTELAHHMLAQKQGMVGMGASGVGMGSMPAALHAGVPAMSTMPHPGMSDDQLYEYMIQQQTRQLQLQQQQQMAQMSAMKGQYDPMQVLGAGRSIYGTGGGGGGGGHGSSHPPMGQTDPMARGSQDSLNGSALLPPRRLDASIDSAGSRESWGAGVNGGHGGHGGREGLPTEVSFVSESRLVPADPWAVQGMLGPLSGYDGRTPTRRAPDMDMAASTASTASAHARTQMQSHGADGGDHHGDRGGHDSFHSAHMGPGNLRDPAVLQASARASQRDRQNAVEQSLTSDSLLLYLGKRTPHKTPSADRVREAQQAHAEVEAAHDPFAALVAQHGGGGGGTDFAPASPARRGATRSSNITGADTPHRHLSAQSPFASPARVALYGHDHGHDHSGVNGPPGSPLPAPMHMPDTPESYLRAHVAAHAPYGGSPSVRAAQSAIRTPDRERQLNVGNNSSNNNGGGSGAAARKWGTPADSQELGTLARVGEGERSSLGEGDEGEDGGDDDELYVVPSSASMRLERQHDDYNPQSSIDQADLNYSRELFESADSGLGGLSLDDTGTTTGSGSYQVHTPTRHERDAMRASVDDGRSSKEDGGTRDGVRVGGSGGSGGSGGRRDYNDVSGDDQELLVRPASARAQKLVDDILGASMLAE